MKLDKWKVGSICYKLTMPLFIIALFLSNKSFETSKNFFVSIFLVLVLGTIFLWFERRKIELDLAIQIAPIFILVSMFWILALMNNISIKCDFHYKIAIYGMIVLLLVTLFWLQCVFFHRKEWKYRIKRFLKKNNYIFCVIVLFVIFYIDCFTFLFKSDSNTYYQTSLNCLSGWKFVLSDLEQFKLGYHLTYGYSLFISIGNYLFPNDGIGIRAINLLLMIQTLFFMNGINRELFQKKSKWMYSLLLCCFAFNPIILGIIQEMNIDMPMMWFFVWVVWAYLKKKDILLIFSSLLFVFSKENAVFVLGGLVLGIVIYRGIIQIKDNRNLNPFFLFEKNEWFVGMSFVCFVICSFFLGNRWGAESTQIESQLGLVNTFQFNLEYIGYRLKQLCILNFQWIVVIMCLVFIIFFIYKRPKVKIRDIHCGMIVAAIFYNLFQLLYFTFPHYRYFILNAFFTELMIGGIIFYITKNKKIQINVLLVLSALFLGQSYFPIDFVSNNLFKTISTGNGKIISLSHYSSSLENPSVLITEQQGGNLDNEKFRDYVQHSRQYTRFEKCFEEVLTEINYDSNKGIMIIPLYDEPGTGKTDWTFVNLFGVTDANTIHYNEITKQLSFDTEDNSINWISYTDLQNNYDLYSEIWMIEFPYETPNKANYPSDYTVIESKTINYGEWKIVAHCLKR